MKKRIVELKSIEFPLHSFHVSVQRANSFNGTQMVLGMEEVWEVLASTPNGAIKIAQWHFYKSQNIKLIGR